jgi:predicted DNA-binding transcriptional regulator AlpA
MSDDIYMQRGKSQVLFNYLPNNTFDYTGEKGIHKVEKVETIPHTESNQSYIIEQVKNRVNAWEAGSGYGAVGYPKYEEDYQLVRPREVKTSLFPLLFECTSCDRIHTYDDTDELDRYNRDLECKNCGGTIQQRQLVFLHECGEIETPYPYKCDQCESWDDWELETYGSQRFRNTEWSCDNCGYTKDFSARCECDLESSNMTPYVHRASSAFQPQHISVIDIGSDIDTDPNRASFSKAVVARYLGLTDEEIPDIQLEEQNTTEERETLEWQLEQYEDMYEKSGSEDVKEQIEDIESHLAEMGEAAGPVGEQVESYVPALAVDETDDDELPQLIQQGVFDAYQFHSVHSKLDRTSAREVIETAGEDTPVARRRREARAENVRQEMGEMGIEEVAFIENFPITNAVFGYTRIENDPDNSRLMAFSPSSVSSSNDGTPIFADTVDAEAVQFNLDPRKVLRWLLENSRQGPQPSQALRRAIVESDLPGDRQVPHPNDWDFETRDNWLGDTQLEPGETESLAAWGDSDIRAWIISNMGQVPELDEISMGAEDQAIIAYMLYHLVHSFAHLALKQVAQLSGMSRTSIAEYLLPRSLSFVIYSNQRTDYNIGGMYTLVESSLDDLLNGINQRGNDCVYDPVCSREGASCHNCLYISEVSCTHLNRNLGRDFAFGSKPIADRGITGYLELDYDE